MIIKNARIIKDENDTIIQDILIKEKKIYRIADFIEADEELSVDIKGNLLFAGGVDVHVHLREPGFESKETILSGTLAALRGGYTTIFAMPNVVPYPDSHDVMKSYLQQINECAQVKVHPYACITKNEKGNEVVDMKHIAELGIHWFSDDGVGVQNDSLMEVAMKQAKSIDAMIVAHTEDMAYRKPFACMHEGIRSQQLGLLGIPSECEYKQVERDLKLAEKTHVKYHVCHVSSKESVQLIREYQARGVDVSGEVTTHHLLLNEMDVNNTNHKMNPPLRSIADQEALLEAIQDGTITCIANDHAPHTASEKAQPMDTAPFGIVALETSIPLLYTHLVKTNKITLAKFQQLIATNPANRFGLVNTGAIKEGYYADFFVLEEYDGKIDIEKTVSKGKNSPFHNYDVSGKITMTIVDGKIMYQEGE